MASSDADRPSWESGIDKGRVDGIGLVHHIFFWKAVDGRMLMLWGEQEERLELRGRGGWQLLFLWAMKEKVSLGSMVAKAFMRRRDYP